MKGSKIREALSGVFPAIWAVSFAFMAWKSLCLATGTPSPVLVVISESMAPAFHRGDLIFLWNREELIRAGDIPVVWFQGNPLPMVHRAVQVTYERDSSGSVKQLILTKGDNNPVDDVLMYPSGRTTVSREEIRGFVRGYVPGVGRLSLMLQSGSWIVYPAVALLFTMAMMA